MEYSLAKELKENGLVWEEMNQLTLSRKETFPTLSELIEACEEEGHILTLEAYCSTRTILSYRKGSTPDY